MDVLIAIAIVLIALYFIKSIWLVILIAVAVAVVVWILRNGQNRL